MPAAAAEWEPVIGLEVHAQLKTDTKMFCGCKTSFGDPPNTHVCPVCLGLPGSLPVPNEKAFRMALKAALALNCRIAGFTKADRKNYYYPDLPKNYQISQYDLPFATQGWLDLTLPDGARRRIGITRVHVEEDAGKLVHDESGGGGESGVDLNRAGTPLIEIVSEPDLRSPAEARAYMEALAQVLLYLDVCDCNMQEGSLRCDANVSVRPKGQRELNTRREIKNMNSFRFVEMAVEAEIREQGALYEAGGTVEQSTRLFNGQTGEIRTMRTKEHAQDYRYFPEPDLPPVTITPELIAAVRAEIGEMPDARLRRYREQLGLSAYDAGVLVEHKALGDYFEQLLAAGAAAKAAANWIISDCQGILKEKGLRIENCGITPARMAELLKLVEAGAINRATAKDKVFPVMLEAGKDAAEIVKEKGLAQVSDSAAIKRTVEEVLTKNQGLVADFINIYGKDASFNAIFGLCMKNLGGKGNPSQLREVLLDRLCRRMPHWIRFTPKPVRNVVPKEDFPDVEMVPNPGDIVILGIGELGVPIGTREELQGFRSVTELIDHLREKVFPDYYREKKVANALRRLFAGNGRKALERALQDYLDRYGEETTG